MLTSIIEGSIYRHYTRMSLDWSKAEWKESGFQSENLAKMINIPFTTVPFRLRSGSQHLREDMLSIVEYTPFGMGSLIRHPPIGIRAENGKILADIMFPYPANERLEVRVRGAMCSIDQWLDLVRNEIERYKPMQWDIVTGIIEDILEDRFAEIHEVHRVVGNLNRGGGL